MDKPRQQDALYSVKNSEKKSTPQEQKPESKFKAPFSKGSNSEDKKSPLTAAKRDDRPASQKPQQQQPQQHKPPQAGPGNDAKKGK
ncbi:hypothetical protein [Sedimenticola sp.]|uniref:hypothetical protein n=1 Tax=Sedimenticola sp. TaxID=1940285 RepID=UPI0025909DFC|nr:hypothetical protein [Sedimenticola sp.]MCW8905110.1 hypothetical protein [Sedimenticola sp.]